MYGLIQWVGQKPQDNQDVIVCLGFFDGVHKGHQKLIQTALQAKAQTGALVCVHTYDESPIHIIRAGKADLELTPFKEKVSLLFSLGVDTVAVSHFDKQMMEMSGDDFLDQVLLKAMRVTHIITGYDHRFGYHGKTGPKELESLCNARGIQLSVVPAVTLENGMAVSSTAIREAIQRGEIQTASEMLGREPDEQMIKRVAQGDI